MKIQTVLSMVLTLVAFAAAPAVQAGNCQGQAQQEVKNLPSDGKGSTGEQKPVQAPVANDPAPAGKK